MSGYRPIALTASIPVFMQYLDATAITTALPAIAADLRVAPIDLNVAILAYQLALVVFIPLGGVLANRIGARNAFIASLLLFMLGAVASAMAWSLGTLVAARALQGIGGAIMIPVSRLLVLRSAERHELISAMNWLVIPGIVGPLIGPALGGFLVSYASWHMIFLVNLPMALLGIVMSLWLVPDRRDAEGEVFDARGTVIVAILIVSLVIGLSGVTGQVAPAVTIATLLIALTTALLYLHHHRRTEAPIIDLTLWAIPSFRLSMLSGTLIRCLFGAHAFLLPLWFQLAMGFEAAKTGVMLAAGTVGVLVSRLVGGPLIARSHPRSVSVGGGIVFALSLFGTAFLRADLPLPLFYLLIFGQGFGLALAMLVIGPAAYVEVPAERMAAATGFYSTVQQLTLSLGVITGVWSLAAMRWLTHATPYDNRAYAGSMLLLALLALGAVMLNRRFEPDAIVSLRPVRATRSA